MSIVLSVVGVSFAALCVWLGVRIYNRRERWAKWTLASIVGAPVLYVAGFGPACWLSSRTGCCARLVTMIYSPIFWPFGRTIIAFPQPTVVKAIFFYGRCGAADGWGWSFMEGGEEGNLVGIWSRYERG